MTNDVVELTAQSFGDPRTAAKSLLSVNLSVQQLWSAAALVAILTAVYSSVLALTVNIEAIGLQPGVAISPLQQLVQAAIILAISIFVGHGAALAFGGTGQLNHTLMVMVWAQFVNIFAQAVLLPIGWVVPSVWVLLFSGISLFMIWVTAQFLREAHGFRSVGPGIGIVIITSLATIYVAGLLT